MAPIPTDVHGNPSAISGDSPATPASPAPPKTAENSDHKTAGIAIADAERNKKPAWNPVPNNSNSNAGSGIDIDSWPALSAKKPPSSSSSESLNSIPELKNCGIPAVSSQGSNNARFRNLGTADSFDEVHRKFDAGGFRRGGFIRDNNVGDLLAQTVLASAGFDNGSEFFNRDFPNNGIGNWDGSRGGEFEVRPNNGGGRRGNSGSGGSFRGGHGGRREHERGGYEWHAPPRGFNGRDPRMHLPVRGHSRPFIQQPPPPSPAQVSFFSELGQVRPFLGPVPFPELHSGFYYGPPQAPPLEPVRNVPYFPQQIPAPVPPMIHNPQDQEKQAKLLKQIEFYFSPENLCRDTFLRQNMDDQGWVPVSLIANFNRVRQLTNNIDYILDTMRASTKVEVLFHKVRKRNDWMIWLLPPHITHSSPPTSDYNSVVTGISNISVQEASRQ